MVATNGRIKFGAGKSPFPKHHFCEGRSDRLVTPFLLPDMVADAPPRVAIRRLWRHAYQVVRFRQAGSRPVTRDPLESYHARPFRKTGRRKDRMNDHRSAAQQSIIAVAGAAYGVIGADLHIFGDGTPVYLLQRWASAPPPDRSWLRQSPSRMLNARHEVVPFTSRAAELEDLHRWRRQGARLSARWLHGQGGQGKTRLAARFAEETRADGWLVVRAVHGLG